jgi:short-subunit dehydrogenase
VKRTNDELGAIDILVNNAGFTHRTPNAWTNDRRSLGRSNEP